MSADAVQDESDSVDPSRTSPEDVPLANPQAVPDGGQIPATADDVVMIVDAVDEPLDEPMEEPATGISKEDMWLRCEELPGLNIESMIHKICFLHPGPEV